MLHRLLSHDYILPTEPFEVFTEDGVRLRGARFGRGQATLVFVHGFLGWHRKGRLVDFLEAIARWFTVLAFDTRGHGESDGHSTFGDREFLDVEAVARLARERGGPVVTLGASMGGIAVLRHAAFRGGIEAVMAVSTPARWEGHGTAAVRRLEKITSSPAARRVARTLGVRMAPTWDDPEDPEDVIGKIAPTPVLLVHGRDDHFFDVDDAWRLYARAGEPKRLMLASRFGHAEEGFDARFAALAARRIHEAIGLDLRG